VQDHVLGLIDIAGFEKKMDWGEILMPLKESSVKSLVEDFPETDLSALAMRVTKHMLRALKTLAKYDIIHRDIKPENILYETRETGYHFELGDFGLSNDRASARTRAGTEVFMAPEILSRGKQTAKIDIYSLFATIVRINGIDGFREETLNETPEEVHKSLRGSRDGQSF
jgi:serine/threonine protein kinase